MDCSSDGIVLKILHLHWFIANTLSMKCSVSMNQKRNNFFPSFYTRIAFSNMIFSPASSHHNWVNSFKMRRIIKHLNNKFPAIRILSCVVWCNVRFDISRYTSQISIFDFIWLDSLKLSKYSFEGNSDDACEKVQSTSMRHAYDSFFCP